MTRDDQHRPCAKIIVRLRPVLQDELDGGETQSALPTNHRYVAKRYVKLCETEARAVCERQTINSEDRSFSLIARHSPAVVFMYGSTHMDSFFVNSPYSVPALAQ